MLLVISSLGADTHKHTNTDIRTETILKKQAPTGLWPAHLVTANTRKLTFKPKCIQSAKVGKLALTTRTCNETNPSISTSICVPQNKSLI